jgi:hypothetical protein
MLEVGHRLDASFTHLLMRVRSAHALLLSTTSRGAAASLHRSKDVDARHKAGHDDEHNRTKRKRPWGAGVFGRLSQLGVLGSYYPRGDFGGLVKSRVNSFNCC